MKQTFAQKAFIALCLQSGLPAPVPEFRFDTERKWRTDYFFEANGKKVALEIEGGIYCQGRHIRPQGFLADLQKYNALTLHGIYLLRVTPKTLLTQDTILLLKKVLAIE